MTQQTPYGEPVVTGEAVALELRPAGIGSRGVGAIIDLVGQYLLSLALVLILNNTGTSIDSAGADALALTAFVAIVLGYPVGFETLLHGRTPGKMVMGLRVVRDDGGPIRFRHAFVRGLVGVVLERPGLFFFIPALVCMLVNRRSKRVGDLAAGTLVVQERVPAKLAPAPAMPPPLADWAAGLDLSQVNDQLANEVRLFLGRAGQLAAWARADMEGRLVHEVATRTAPPPPGVPGWAYLTAVLAERRRRELLRLQPAPVATAPAAPAAAAPATPAPPAAPPPTQQPPEPSPPPAGPFAPPQ